MVVGGDGRGEVGGGGRRKSRPLSANCKAEVDPGRWLLLRSARLLATFTRRTRGTLEGRKDGAPGRCCPERNHRRRRIGSAGAAFSITTSIGPSSSSSAVYFHLPVSVFVSASACPARNQDPAASIGDARARRRP